MESINNYCNDLKLVHTCNAKICSNMKEKLQSKQSCVPARFAPITKISQRRPT